MMCSGGFCFADCFSEFAGRLGFEQPAILHELGRLEEFDRCTIIDESRLVNMAGIVPTGADGPPLKPNVYYQAIRTQMDPQDRLRRTSSEVETVTAGWNAVLPIPPAASCTCQAHVRRLLSESHVLRSGY
jgi:hypothetical protein